MSVATGKMAEFIKIFQYQNNNRCQSLYSHCYDNALAHNTIITSN